MPQAKFVSGNIFRHILIMSSTNAIGLTALFVVDLADLFFISLLGEAELAAAVGYAGTIAFFTTSISIGLSIAMTALVSKSIGQKDLAKAKRQVINVFATGLVMTSIVAFFAWFYSSELVTLIGAKGRTHDLAVEYLSVLLPSLPILGIGMSAGAALRSVGDAKRAMWSTLAAGGVNAVLDPIFIFTFDMGLYGAATASVIARCTVAAVALHGLFFTHKLIGHFDFKSWLTEQAEIMRVAIPAMATNIATPIGNAYVMMMIAGFGDSFVAGWAVIGRVLPVCFGMIFSLSGAIGPIIGQNFGAQYFDRVALSLKRGLQFTVVFVAILSVILYLVKGLISAGFNATGEAAELIEFYFTWLSFSFAFNGMLFVSNAVFNNLGFPKTSTLMNIGKATLGTIPFVYLGGEWFGVYGVLSGQAIGSVIFGVVAMLWAFRTVSRVTDAHQEASSEVEEPLSPALSIGAFSSSRAYLCSEAETDLNKSDS